MIYEKDQKYRTRQTEILFLTEVQQWRHQPSS